MSNHAEEWFDVVDENDRPIGQKLRSEVHRLKLRHRAVHMFVQRADGALLIHKRTASKEEFPDVWTSSSCGHVNSGESYAEAAERELMEELGITTELHRCHKFDACPETSMEFTELFDCRWDGDVMPDPEEIQAIEWKQLSEIANRVRQLPDLFSPAFRLLFRWYRRQS